MITSLPKKIMNLILRKQDDGKKFVSKIHYPTQKPTNSEDQFH